MSARHSPGPWWAERREIFAGERDMHARFIAEVYSGDCASLEEADANERLVAAAPTLAQVLRDLTDAVHSQEPATIARGMRAAAAALAQVEGGTCATE